MVKTAQDDGPAPTFGDHSEFVQERLPGHHNFAKRVSVGSGLTQHTDNAVL